MLFKRLHLEHWKQFARIDLELHPRMTILVGPNACGKTTVLRTLARTLDLNPYHSELATAVTTDGGHVEYRAWTGSSSQDAARIGVMEFPGGQRIYLDIPTTPFQQPEFNIGPSFPRVAGFALTSHRRAPRYHQAADFKLTPPVASSVVREALDATNNLTDRAATWSMKSYLLTLAVLGGGSPLMEPDLELRQTYDEFVAMLKELLPDLRGIKVRGAEVVLQSDAGEHLLDATSGGMVSLIEMAWLLLLYRKMTTNDPFVVLIDEVENHLHSGIQRKILPDLSRLYPEVQFIVTTHSPLVAASVRECSVYVLDFNDSGRVESRLIDVHDRSGPASEVLRRALGVSVTMPIWVEDALNKVIELNSSLPPDEALKNIRAELQKQGLEEYVPLTLAEASRRSSGLSA